MAVSNNDLGGLPDMQSTDRRDHNLGGDCRRRDRSEYHLVGNCVSRLVLCYTCSCTMVGKLHHGYV